MQYNSSMIDGLPFGFWQSDEYNASSDWESEAAGDGASREVYTQRLVRLDGSVQADLVLTHLSRRGRLVVTFLRRFNQLTMYLC